MNSNWKRSVGGAVALVVLGVAALYAGPHWLALLIPAATLIWLGAGPMIGSGRN